MPYETYRFLPLKSLYELLGISIKDMLAALDAKHVNRIAYKAVRKQVEILLLIIDEKKQVNTPLCKT